MEAVLQRLKTLGYETEDTAGVEQAIAFAEEELLRLTNLDEMPEGLAGVLIERAAERYLLMRGVRSLRCGEVTWTFSSAPPDVSRFRKVVW